MRISKALAICFILGISLAHAGELQSLISQYTAARDKTGGVPDERAKKVQEKVVPILKRIGDLDTDESLAFLVRELDTAPSPEIQAACAEPISSSSNPKAVSFLLKGLMDKSTTHKSKAVSIALLEALGKTKHDLSPQEAELLSVAQAVQDAELKKRLLPILQKLDTPGSAKALLLHVQSPKGGKGEDAQRAYNEGAFPTLKATKNIDVKKWLASGAFDAYPDAARLTLLARLAGELRLEEARGHLEKLLSHASPDVSRAALGSLLRIGLAGGSAEGIIAALEKKKSKGDLSFEVEALDGVARKGTDDALEVILRFARGSDPEMRAVAMGSLSLFKGNPKAQKALLERLEDPDPSARATALRALSNLREKFMIEPLIAFLGKEAEERLKVNALDLLVKLTGQNMGLVEADWKKWWEIAKDRFELPKEGNKAFTSVRAYDLSYFGIEVSSKKVGFLVDVSGSMTETVPVKSAAGKDDEKEESKGSTVVTKGEAAKGDGEKKDSKTRAKGSTARKIDVLKRELTRVLKKLSPDTQINILTFNKKFEAWQPQLQVLSESGRSRAVQFVEGLQTSPGTNVFDTLEFALKDKRMDTIYLLTDGLPTDGRIKEPKALCEEIAKQNRQRGVTIHCIAFGAESPLLKDLAAQNGGQYRYVDKY